VQVSAATPQTNQSQVTVTYAQAQVAGDTNILAIGWKDATSTITSVRDSAGNTYHPVSTARGKGLSQAIYYAAKIKAAAAGTNIVTVSFNTAAPFIDIRATEYSGLDPSYPIDVFHSAGGTNTTPSSGSVATTAAQEVIFGAGTTTGAFTAAGPNFTSRIITTPNGDIAEDMFVTATGSYSAAATLSGSAAWIMHVVALRNAGQLGPSGVDVVTQHYDVQRTGWNSQETVLTASNVNNATFGLLHSVAVDDEVDAQPLVLTNQLISGVQGTRTVVYVATEGNTIYAIDASSGTVLKQKNFGTPVSQSVLGNCNNNTIHIGITSTPVIDRAAGKLYAAIYTSDAGVPTYRLHALNLTTLTDVVSPVVVTASHTLTDGTTYTFQASKNRQRAGLLEANGKIYVGFASFCDFFQNVSRGWVLGWNASTLKPLAANQLNDKLAASPNSFFLSSVWMSGNGLAASPTGGIFFTTGNSDAGSYDSVNNLSESVVNMSSDLTHVTDFFTPSNVNILDANDADLASGGVLLIPTQAGPIPNLAVALAKEGHMYLMSQQNLGKFTPGGPDNILGTFPMQVGDACWCAESYYMGSDGVGRVVSSAGNTMVSWKIQTSPSVTLVGEWSQSTVGAGQDGGFFTWVSSNGTQAGTAIIWAVSRPANTSPANDLLYAFNAVDGSLLFSANAGTWPNPGNANIVPVVANGQVFVASNQQLAIFGPIAAGAKVAAPLSTVASQTSVSKVSGWVDQINGTDLVVRNRNGAHITIDAKPAKDAHQSVPIGMEEAITAEGNYDAQGVLHAQTIVRAKNSRDLWPPDR
jgi:hypothetical protein